MKNANIKIAVMAVLVLGLLSSCFLFPPEALEISGIWDMGSVWEIDENSFTVTNDPAWNWDYSGEVVSFSNDSYNEASENPADGDFGYMVIKYTEHTGDSSYVGTYNVFRWNSLTDTTMEYSEGYKFGADKFTSADEAEAGATVANGYFGSFSSATKQ